MNQHITPEQAGRWVSGLLEGDDAMQLETHAAGCPACTALLQAEAQAEQELRGVVVANRGSSQVVPLVSRPARVTSVVVALAGLAATALFLVKPLHNEHPAQVPSHPPTSFTGKPHGNIEPALEMEVPRYEEGFTVPEIDKRARGPFPL